MPCQRHDCNKSAAPHNARNLGNLTSPKLNCARESVRNPSAQLESRLHSIHVPLLSICCFIAQVRRERASTLNSLQFTLWLSWQIGLRPTAVQHQARPAQRQAAQLSSIMYGIEQANSTGIYRKPSMLGGESSPELSAREEQRLTASLIKLDPMS